jgi:hypothetical protein
MARPKHPNLDRAWLQRIQRHASSGLSTAAFCRREGLSARLFYAWGGRLRARSHSAECGKNMHFRSLTGPSSKITIAWGCPSPAPPGERAAQCVSALSFCFCFVVCARIASSGANDSLIICPLPH